MIRKTVPLLFALSFLLCLPASAKSLIGKARVVDGDTIIVSGERLRLMGFDAPESKQTCLSPVGIERPCGRKATEYLDLVLSTVDHQVACKTFGQDRYQRTLARCVIGDLYLGSWMVRSGHAVVWPRGDQWYLADQDDARLAKRGLWAGQFEFPWVWRRAR
ncbi:thermonuclease family protein [Kiloniella sp. b19]|uniref:thermonuclease family protein n=1 Tax=Kiloniella sp. GXU_MW_B19 TaxID=3141326 RepID=UPI0031D4717F